MKDWIIKEMINPVFKSFIDSTHCYCLKYGVTLHNTAGSDLHLDRPIIYQSRMQSTEHTFACSHSKSSYSPPPSHQTNPCKLCADRAGEPQYVQTCFLISLHQQQDTFYSCSHQRGLRTQRYWRWIKKSERFLRAYYDYSCSVSLYGFQEVTKKTCFDTKWELMGINRELTHLKFNGNTPIS